MDESEVEVGDAPKVGGVTVCGPRQMAMTLMGKRGRFKSPLR